MDTLRGFDDDRIEHDDYDHADLNVDDNSSFDIGLDERRMHVRAYNYWVSLLAGRSYPAIGDLVPETIADFGPHSVLLDFTGGIEDPAIQFLGSALREECDFAATVTHISQVPSRSLLSRLTDHYLQIIANRAPIGFEAEFVNTRGHNTMYRGILMPFSSDEDTIDFIYGVINWKELVDAETQAQLNAEVEEAIRQAPRSPVSAPVWASGPSGGSDGDEASLDLIADDDGAMPLADQLMLAQQTAATVRAADTRSRAALYRALARAYDFASAADADPLGYTALRDAAGIAAQDRAPMTPIVKLVFGAEYDKTRLTEFAAVLAHARRMNVPTGALGDLLDMAEGGIKGIVAAERALRRPPNTVDRQSRAMATLAARPTLGEVTLQLGATVGDLVVLVARASAPGQFEIIGSVAATDSAGVRAIAAAAR